MMRGWVTIKEDIEKVKIKKSEMLEVYIKDTNIVQ